MRAQIEKRTRSDFDYLPGFNFALKFKIPWNYREFNFLNGSITGLNDSHFNIQLNLWIKWIGSTRMTRYFFIIASLNIHAVCAYMYAMCARVAVLSCAVIKWIWLNQTIWSIEIAAKRPAWFNGARFKVLPRKRRLNWND